MIKNSLGEIKLTQSQDKTALMRNQSDVKEVLLQHQTNVKEELVRKQSNVEQALAVHVAQDEGKFDSIGRTLTRFDTTLQRMSEGQQKSHTA